MAMNYTERELRKLGDNDLAKIIAGAHDAFKKRHPELGDIALPQSTRGPKKDKLSLIQKPSTAELDQLSIEAEWQDQAQRFIELGFHSELGLTEEQYLATLPKFEPQPEEYRGRFDVSLLVETRIPWEKQAKLACIVVSDYLMSRINETREWEGNHSQTPDVPYTGWFNSWGQRFAKQIRPFDARDQLAADECGAGPFEGVAQQVHHPEVTLEGKYFDLIGYSVESGNVPYLLRWDGGPGLSAD